MNPAISELHPYPFEKLQSLMADVTPNPERQRISLSIGEPQHPTPKLILQAIRDQLPLAAKYPTTKGSIELRTTIAEWLQRRFKLSDQQLDPDRQILPVNGTREALFAFAQCMVNASDQSSVLMPNPFYQIYEGAALLAGAEPRYMNCLVENAFIPDLQAVSTADWQRCRILYLCSPGNPTGAVLDLEFYRQALHLAEQHNFILAADECYSEIYFDELSPPLGLLQAANELGYENFQNCVVFHSLSKRSNAPGIRSGFVAGDETLIQAFLRYRTYHGCAMAPFTQAASVLAWQDENHVQDNRQRYREKFQQVCDILQPVLPVTLPDAGFYLWPELPISDTEFAKHLLKQENVAVLPGSYLSRDVDGINPGNQRIRMALVAELEACVEAANRIANTLNRL